MSSIIITSSTNTKAVVEGTENNITANINQKQSKVFANATGKGDRGYSAYEVAQRNGFVGTETEWLESLKGDSFEYEDFTEEQLKDLIGPKGDKGDMGLQGPQGIQGIQGPAGKDFSISKTYSSIIEMESDVENIEEGNFVIIASNIDDEDNSKLFVKSSSGFSYISDLSGATGMKGEQGVQGIQGEQGVPGPTGPSNSISIGIVEAGEVAAATITGESPNQQLNLILPKGDKGDSAEPTKSIEEQIGSNLLISASEYNAKEFRIEGKSEQETSVQGKNLLNITDGKNETISGVTFTYQDDGSIILNGTSTEAIAHYNYLTNFNLPAGTYTHSTTNDLVTGLYCSLNNIGETMLNVLKKQTSWTIESETTYTNYLIYIVSGVTFNNYVITPQIEKGSVATAYESFVPNMPSPDYPSKIKTIPNVRNLYNFEDVSSVADSVTADKDGWITVTCDNSAGTGTVYKNYYTNNLNLKTNTNYNIIFEVKSVNGTGSINAVSYMGSTQGQFPSGVGYTFSNLSNGVVKQVVKTTRESFDSIINGVRTFVQFTAGQSGSITFRLSVLENTNITANTFSYVPYGAWAKVKIDNNLFENKNLTSGKYFNSNGEAISNSGWSITDFIEVIPNKNYGIMADGFTDLGASPSTIFYDKDKNYISGLKHDSKTIPTYTTPSSCFYIKESVPTSLANKIKIFSGVEYKEKEVLIDLNIYDDEGNITGYYELCSIGDTKDELSIIDGQVVIDKKISKIVLNGSEDSWNKYIEGFGVNVTSLNMKPNLIGYCDKYIVDNTYASFITKDYAIGYIYQSVSRLYLRNKDYTTLEEFKTWLSENTVTVYYELAEPQQIPLPNTQISLDEGFNHITLVDDLETDLYVKYYTMYKGNKGEQGIQGIPGEDGAIQYTAGPGIEITEDNVINNTDVDPVGTIKLYIGSTAPEGYLICDGSEQSRILYPELYTILGSDYQVSSDVFLVPNMIESRPIATGTSTGNYNVNYIIKSK